MGGDIIFRPSFSITQIQADFCKFSSCIPKCTKYVSISQLVFPYLNTEMVKTTGLKILILTNQF